MRLVTKTTLEVRIWLFTFPPKPQGSVQTGLCNFHLNQGIGLGTFFFKETRILCTAQLFCSNCSYETPFPFFYVRELPLGLGMLLRNRTYVENIFTAKLIAQAVNCARRKRTKRANPGRMEAAAPKPENQRFDPSI